MTEPTVATSNIAEVIIRPNFVEHPCFIRFMSLVVEAPEVSNTRVIPIQLLLSFYQTLGLRQALKRKEIIFYIIFITQMKQNAKALSYFLTIIHWEPTGLLKKFPAEACR